MEDLVHYALLAGMSLAAILNPVAAVPTFLAMTPRNTALERLRMAKRACATAAGVLTAFALLGQSIFKVFGITLPSFQIAGGLVLLLISLDSLRAKRSPVQETPEETDEGTAKEDVSITPLAVPMLSGPGAITTVIMLDTKAEGLLGHAVLFLMILAVCALAYLVFRVAVTGARRINATAMNITTRIMGLLLAATGIEFILGALRAVGALRG
ncbi:MAG: NAAT family transporter [Elusimicrobia bacterium]|nr:NAAT family transporter [Elusimicrobiota bacterium]